MLPSVADAGADTTNVTANVATNSAPASSYQLRPRLALPQTR